MEAFAQLVHRHESQVAAVVCGMLGKGEEAEDVGQEVFIRFYQALDRFRGDAKLSTYLVRIAMNLSINALKRRKRHQAVHGAIEEASKVGVTQGSEWDEVVQRSLRTLPAEFRTVVVLRLMEGYDTAETAEMLQLPIGTVLSRLARAQVKLREQLSKYFKS